MIATAALSLVRAWRAGVDHEAKEGIVDRPGAGPRRNLDHYWAILFKVENGADVDSIRVARQEQWIAVHQLVKNQSLV